MYNIAYVDMDGVIADFVSEYCKVIGHIPQPWPKGEYDLVKVFGEHYKPLNELDYQFWRSLARTINMSRLLFILNKKGYEIILVSSVGTSWDILFGKTMWILLNCKGIPFLPMQTSNKGNILAMTGGDILIDDADLVINTWRNRGGTGFLVPQPWNSGDESQDFCQMLEDTL